VLFSKYLIAVELAGTLLLVALVGAVAIIMHGREQERRRGAEVAP
jgi:NADH:ubiquinone oxidoreductase subunit 6 (subunit J)